MYYNDKEENELCEKIKAVVANSQRICPIHIVYVDAHKYRKYILCEKLILFFWTIQKSLFNILQQF